MNNTSSISKSLFSIINKGGDFVSPKQAAYLNDLAVEGVITVKNTFSFGEYEGRTAKNTKTLTYLFTLSSTGVEKVIKLNSKGESCVYWDRSPSTLTAFAVKSAKRQNKRAKLDMANAVKARIVELEGTLKAVNGVIDAELLSDDVTLLRKASKVRKSVKASIERLYSKYSITLKAFDAA